MSWIDQRPDDAMDGAFTALGPEPVRTVEPTVFREAMSRLGAAVHVITTAGSGGKAGTTAQRWPTNSRVARALPAAIGLRPETG
jgi:flavin reductase